VTLRRCEAGRAFTVKKFDTVGELASAAGEVRQLYLCGIRAEQDVVRLYISVDHLQIVVKMSDSRCQLSK
jgi:hypothetical protein